MKLMPGYARGWLTKRSKSVTRQNSHGEIKTNWSTDIPTASLTWICYKGLTALCKLFSLTQLSLLCLTRLSSDVSWLILKGANRVSDLKRPSFCQLTQNVCFAEEIPYINVPLHTLLVVKSYGYDFEIETVPLKGSYCIKFYSLFAM